MIALIDADIVCYRAAASCEKQKVLQEPEEVAILRVENLMREIIQATKAESYRCFLSPKKNFRYDVYPDYKANRKDIVDPVHRQACKDYLLQEWNAEIFDGCEADDALAWSQCDGSVICSIDKDLKQVEGRHYNFVKQEWDTITKIKGLHNFYAQTIIGDPSDHLTGISGIGPVKAGRYLEGCYEEQEMFDTVYDLYQDKHQLAVNLMCMWLMRTQGETWLHRTSGLTLNESFTELLKGVETQITSRINIMANVE